MKIPQYLKSANAKFYIGYGLNIHDAERNGTIETLTKQVEASLKETDDKETLNQIYLEGCDRLGFDPRNDDLKVSYLIAQIQAEPIPPIMLMFQLMYKDQVEPLVFDNEDMYYYLLGVCATTILASRQDADLADIIIKLLS